MKINVKKEKKTKKKNLKKNFFKSNEAELNCLFFSLRQHLKSN